MESNQSFENLSAQEIFETVGGAPLNTKKNILEYIDTIKKLSKDALSEEQLKNQYTFIDEHIDAMSTVIKVNTLAYLKNELRHKLGKYAVAKQNNENAFLEFYKKTYSHQAKSKEYTWALLDLSKIQDTSVLETLKTINTYALKNKLTPEEKEDILPMIKRIVDTQNLKFVNQLRSMEGVRKAFKIKIVEDQNRLCIISI